MIKAILTGLLIILIAVAIFLTGYLIGYIQGVYQSIHDDAPLEYCEKQHKPSFWEMFIKKHKS